MGEAPFTVFPRDGLTALGDDRLMNAIFAIAVSGMNDALSRFSRASEKVVQSTSGAANDNLPEAITEQIEAKTAFIANAHTIRIADDMMRALLDIGADTHRYR
mgnify:FL=1